MKNIQWFPGHMTKAMRDMESKRDLCDGVICVLDARAPIASVNKNFKKIDKFHFYITIDFQVIKK